MSKAVSTLGAFAILRATAASAVVERRVVPLLPAPQSIPGSLVEEYQRWIHKLKETRGQRESTQKLKDLASTLRIEYKDVSERVNKVARTPFAGKTKEKTRKRKQTVFPPLTPLVFENKPHFTPTFTPYGLSPDLRLCYHYRV